MFRDSSAKINVGPSTICKSFIKLGKRFEVGDQDYGSPNAMAKLIIVRLEGQTMATTR